ncbi:MAG: hypothetical protein Q8N82_03630, partial [Deltaproteobacteria bacterium]|nr:hypothetical protein [Deltaproteobacteria bacterium]
SPHLRARGTLTLLISALPSAHFEPLRLPMRAATISFPYTHRLMFLNITTSGLQHWTAYLPQHADPATPEDLH